MALSRVRSVRVVSRYITRPGPSVPAATVSAVTDHVSGPDDGHEPNAIRRNVGYVVTGWRILQLRRRARRETRLVWYGQWRNYMLPGLAAVAVGVALSMLAGVTTGTAGSLVTFFIALEVAYRAATRPDDPPGEPEQQR